MYPFKRIIKDLAQTDLKYRIQIAENFSYKIRIIPITRSEKPQNLDNRLSFNYIYVTDKIVNLKEDINKSHSNLLKINSNIQPPNISFKQHENSKILFKWIHPNDTSNEISNLIIQYGYFEKNFIEEWNIIKYDSRKESLIYGENLELVSFKQKNYYFGIYYNCLITHFLNNL